MNPVDTTAPGQTDAISLRFDLPHPPETVWRAVSEPALLTRWLLPVTGFALAPGAAFTFETRGIPGWDVVVHCRMLEVEAGRKLRYTWVVGENQLDTVVTFTLAPTAAGTALVIEQTGFKPGQKQNFGGARYGWRMMGERLVALLPELG